MWTTAYILSQVLTIAIYCLFVCNKDYNIDSACLTERLTYNLLTSSAIFLLVSSVFCSSILAVTTPVFSTFQ